MSRPYFVLEITPDYGDRERVEIVHSETVLGRSRKRADIQLADSQASSEHAVIEFDGYHVVVRDLDSTNGTHFRGNRAREFELDIDDVFLIGATRLRLVDVIGTEPPPELHDDLDQETEATRAPSPQQMRDYEGRGDGMPTLDVAPPDLKRVDGKDDRTVAFDRSSIPVGERDTTWKPPPQAGGGSDWAAEARDAAPRRRKRGRGVVGWIGLLAAFYSVAIGVLIVLSPGGKVKVPEVESGPGDDLMELANISWKFANTEYFFAGLLGGDRYDMVERHFKRAKSAHADLEDLRGRARLEKLQELAESVEMVKDATLSFGEKMDFIRLVVLISMGVGFIAGILLFFGLRRTGGILLVLGVGVPLLLKQPMPYEPLFFTGALALLGFIAFVSHWVGRPTR